MSGIKALSLMNRFDFGLDRVFLVTVQEKDAALRTAPQPTAPLSILH
jgi:hypothetical protein